MSMDDSSKTESESVKIEPSYYPYPNYPYYPYPYYPYPYYPYPYYPYKRRRRWM